MFEPFDFGMDGDFSLILGSDRPSILAACRR